MNNNLSTSPKRGKYLLYQDVQSRIAFTVRCEGNDIWLTQLQISELFEVARPNVSMHISSVYQSGELTRNRTSKDFLLVQQEGSRTVKRKIAHFNMDMITTLSYRIRSKATLRFRRWVSKKCKQEVNSKVKKEKLVAS